MSEEDPLDEAGFEDRVTHSALHDVCIRVVEDRQRAFLAALHAFERAARELECERKRLDDATRLLEESCRLMARH